MVKLNGGGPLDGHLVDDSNATPVAGHYVVWSSDLDGMVQAHLYDAYDGVYQGTAEVCGGAFPIWNDQWGAYETHYCGLWAGHETDFHVCPCGVHMEGE